MAGEQGFRIVGTADFRAILEGFKQVQASGAQAGAAVSESLKRAGDAAPGSAGKVRQVGDAFKATGDAARQAGKDVDGTREKMGQAAQSASQAASLIRAAGTALAGLGISAAVGAFAKTSFDAAAAAESATVRIKALTQQYGETDRAQQIVVNSAKLLNLTNTEAAEGFLQLYGSLRPTGISLADIETVFTATNAAAKNFGLSAASVQSAVLQLSQGLAAGALQGDELRSIMEQMPPVAQAIAKEMGITVGQVKKFGSEGKITSDIVIKAIKGMNETELAKLATSLDTTAEKLKAFSIQWNNLQVAIGDNLIPAVLPIIQTLTKALEGLGVVLEAKQLGLGGGLLGYLGIIRDDAGAVVGSLRVIQEQSGLTGEKVRLLFAALAEAKGGRVNALGELQISARQLQQVMAELPGLARNYANLVNESAGATDQATAAAERLKLAQQAAAAEAARIRTEVGSAGLALESAAMGAERLQMAMQVNDSLLGLGRALEGLEQSRFDIAKARNQYELQAAQQRGASETEIESIKRNGQLIEAQALQARAQSLLSIQELERQSLVLTQEKARIEADLALQGARVKALEAEAAVQEAIGKGDERATALAQQKLELAQQVVGLEQQRRDTLAQTQPIEQQIAAAGAETARNALQAQAAAMGLRLEANGTVTAMQGVNQSFQVLATSQGLTEGGQRRLRELAAATGLEVRQAADGTVQIGKSLGAAGTPAGQLVEALKNAADPAGSISGSFVKLGERAPAAVQGSRDFAGYLSSAALFSKQVSDPKIAGEVGKAANQADSLANKMSTSARAAEAFYKSLQQASGLPGSRWTGGPVEAGAAYRINELGQESLLGPGGRLSLINAPANSLWRAPRPGVVLPAGVTAQLKEQGVFGATASLGGGGAAVAGGDAAGVLAQQAVEIGRLRQAISELARKTWNVGVKVRSDGSAVSFLNQMGRMR